MGETRHLHGLGLFYETGHAASAYDWVLPTEIPDKGRVLTQLSLWWFDQLADLVPNHVLSAELPAGAPADWAGRT
ncbi:phosphoribosylaminoimidazolesuccinocarboxamide synthase, partial [Streptomyces sp. wa22]|uniref:phosphoribosylaminoimidazolesuccinocarboxamide synthase n=1 Tax=Streptomyces sp. wa22 TaxID=1828244 RepID=UPI0012D03E11